MNQLKEAVEVFLSVAKWFGLFVLLNNAIWFGVVYSLVHDNAAEITQTQDGEHNIQEMTNG